MSVMTLWDYAKSSASYRVRIALNLLGEPYEIETVDLLDDAHKSDAHLARNPQGLVPVLDIDGHRLTQSLAILDYLDTTRDMRLLPTDDPARRAKVIALAHCLAVDVHPVCNRSVMEYATGGAEPARTEWMQRFIGRGLRAFEILLADLDPAPFVTGAHPGLAEICLIPQLYNADRWGVDYDHCPGIKALQTTCNAHPAFQRAYPGA
ncbi:maleylacetoacetate isomerase [Gymnodinialimonas sp. 2305UL16-5]|uniref:maleylacetoacetate isomerase n=1 Tax=Gymnodinialimonas mytili TaxID=3126503 RepID=UPI0030AA7D24